jgi:hypothetical protein
MDLYYPSANPAEGSVMTRYVGDMAERLVRVAFWKKSD